MNDAHETLEPLLSAYLDGELDPTRHQMVAAHLAACAICTQELAQMKAGDEVLAGLPPAPGTPDLRPGLRRRLRRQGAHIALAGGLIALAALILRSVAHDLAIVTRKDLPLWGRLGIITGNLLLAVPGIALCLELARDARQLVEYAWLSDDTSDAGDATGATGDTPTGDTPTGDAQGDSHQ